VPLNLFSGGEQDFPPELRDNLRAIAYRAIYAHVEGLRSDAELNADRGGADAS
jgi:hypothetical protein